MVLGLTIFVGVEVINHVNVDVGKVRAEMNTQFDVQEAIAKGLGEKLEHILDALVQPTQKDQPNRKVSHYPVTTMSSTPLSLLQ